MTKIENIVNKSCSSKLAFLRENRFQEDFNLKSWYRDSLIYAASIYADLIYADVWILSVPWFTRFYSLNYTDFLKGKLNILYFGGKVAWILFFPWVPLQESGTHGLELLKRPLNLVILNGRMFILMYREFSYSVDFWDWSKKLCYRDSLMSIGMLQFFKHF